MRLLIALAALVLGCTHMPWNPHRGWRAWKTSNVTLYTDTLREYEPALEWLEEASLAYQSTFFRDYRVPPAEVVYMSSESPSPFRTNGGNYKHQVTVARSSWAETHGGRVLTIVGWSGVRGPYRHQMAHHFIEATVPRAPLWFNEGLAAYLTDFTGLPDRPGVLCFGRVQPVLTTKVTLPLKELLAAGYHDFNESSAPWIAPLSQSFVDYLLQGEGGRLRPRFFRLMRELIAGKGGEEAIASAFPDMPLDRLEAAFHDHVRTIRPPGTDCPLAVPLAPVARGRTEPVRSELSEADIHALFGNLEQLPERDGYADFFPDALPATARAP